MNSGQLMLRRKGAGRPRKPPGAPVDHRLSDAMKQVIGFMVVENITRKEAAERAGITEGAVYNAMRNSPLAHQFYDSEVKSFVACLRHKAAHALAKELDGPNAAARVAAARSLLEGAQQVETSSRHSAPAPGVVIVIEQKAAPLPLATPVIEIEARPAES